MGRKSPEKRFLLTRVLKERNNLLREALNREVISQEEYDFATMELTGSVDTNTIAKAANIMVKAGILEEV